MGDWSSRHGWANQANNSAIPAGIAVAARFSHRNNGNTRRWFDWRMTQA